MDFFHTTSVCFSCSFGSVVYEEAEARKLWHVHGSNMLNKQHLSTSFVQYSSAVTLSVQSLRIYRVETPVMPRGELQRLQHRQQY